MSVVYTIGYEGVDILTFIRTLKIVGIDAIADVRDVPFSRKKGFSKAPLQSILLENNIKYLPFRNLGDPKSGRDAAKTKNYKLFEKIFCTHLKLEEPQKALIELASYAKNMKVCLLCFERDYKTCHRYIIAKELQKIGFEIFNLYADDPERYERNREHLPEFQLCAAE